MSIPREDLHAIVTAVDFTTDVEGRDVAVAALTAVAASLRDRSTAAADARKKGWKGESERLFAIAQEVEAYAEALAAMELDGAPVERPAPIVEGDVPDLSSDAHANQCASLEPPPYAHARRQRCMLTAQPPHTGKHIGDQGAAWPSTAVEPVVPQQRAVKQITAAGDGYEIVTTGATAVAVLDRPEDTAGPLSPADQFMSDLGQPIPAGPMPTGVPHELEPPTMPREIRDINVNTSSVGLVSQPAHPALELPQISGTALGGPAPTPATFFDLFAPVGGVPKDHQSPSSIKTYAGCGLRYRFTYREGIESRPMWAGVGGTAYHTVVQEIDRAHALEGRFDPAGSAQQYETYASEVWKDAFAREIDKQSAQQRDFADPAKWYVANGGKEDQAWWWSNGEDMVRRYLHTRPAWHAEGWRLLGTPSGGVAQELKFTIVRAGVPVEGYIDDVWINAQTGALRIRDLKSGARKEESDFQLKVYGAALRDLGAAAPDQKVTGSYFMARKGEHDRPMTLSAKDDALIAYRARATDDADRAEVFVPNPSSFCGACPFRRVCPAA